MGIREKIENRIKQINTEIYEIQSYLNNNSAYNEEDETEIRYELDELIFEKNIIKELIS